MQGNLIQSQLQTAQIKATEQTGRKNALPKQNDDVQKAAEEFESVFLAQVLQNMFTDISTDGAFSGGHAEETWQSMITDQYGRMISKSGGIGLADHVQKTLLEMQEQGSV